MEIKQRIKEEAIRHAESKGIYDSFGVELIRREFETGANFVLSQLRWRKVEEELPEVGSDILMKQKSEYGIHYGTFTDIPQHIIDIIKKEYDEWMPIFELEQNNLIDNQKVFAEALKEMGFEKICAGQYQRIDLGCVRVPEGDLFEFARQVFFLGKSAKCNEVANVLGLNRGK